MEESVAIAALGPAVSGVSGVPHTVSSGPSPHLRSSPLRAQPEQLVTDRLLVLVFQFTAMLSVPLKRTNPGL